MDTKQKIEVMQAYESGKVVQSRPTIRVELPWEDVLTPVWNWHSYIYRVKPQPRVVYINEYHNGLLGLPQHTVQDAKLKEGLDFVRCIKFREVIEE